jgi:NitT/TauT family transport system substrate-binding protein
MPALTLPRRLLKLAARIAGGTPMAWEPLASAGNARRIHAILPAVLAAFALACGGAQAAEKVTFLLPAQLFRPALSPWVLAKERHYYEKEGLDLEFQIVTGGAEVAKQVGVGNAAMGEAVADATIIVRANGVPVKAVGLIGGGSFTQLIVREDSPIMTPTDLKGRTITVFAYQDTTYYALLGALANGGLTKNDVNIVAGGPTNTWTMFVAKTSDAMGVAPDYIAYVTKAGVKVRVIPISQYFPTMAQTILASDETIAKRPDLIRKVVRATLRGMADILKDPDGATHDFVKATPENADREPELRQVIAYYDKYVFSGQDTPGEMDETRLAKLQDYYVKQHIVDKAVPVTELYTNAFVK